MSIAQFRESVAATIRNGGMLDPGTRVGVALSGGADSLALLDVLHSCSQSWRLDLVVLHVNHGLRGEESEGDARFVQDWAAALGLLCRIANLPLPPEENIEQAARELRYAWFRDCMAELNLSRVALGHTRSDQAETVLFRFLRGAGTAGLSGIRPKTRDGFVRPLLGVARNQVRSYLTERELVWREDSSNQELRFARNRIRSQLMPQLAREWNPAIEANLAAAAEWAQGEEAYWECELRTLAGQHLAFPDRSTVLARADSFGQLPIAAARRLLRYAVAHVRGDLRSIEFAHVERIRDLALLGSGSGRLQIPGVDVILSFDWLRLAPPGSYKGERHCSTSVTVPGEYRLSVTNSVIGLQSENWNCRYNEGVNSLDGDRLSGPLELRTWQPGDQYRPAGYRADVKLKTLFQDARIPIWDRRAWPVLTKGERIAWTRQFGAAEEFAAGGATRRAIVVREVRDQFAEPESASRRL